jgi:hypothetical protein
MKTCPLTKSFLYFLFIVWPKAPSFVPRSHGVVSPLSKNVVAASVYSSRGSRQDIKMMPIGVPKVAYRVPGSQQADWYVVACVLLENRVKMMDRDGIVRGMRLTFSPL